jgi:hypothetical protein
MDKSLENPAVVQLVKESWHFMKPEGPSSGSQEPIFHPDPGPSKFSPQSATLLAFVGIPT